MALKEKDIRKLDRASAACTCQSTEKLRKIQCYHIVDIAFHQFSILAHLFVFRFTIRKTSRWVKMRIKIERKEIILLWSRTNSPNWMYFNSLIKNEKKIGPSRDVLAGAFPLLSSFSSFFARFDFPSFFLWYEEKITKVTSTMVLIFFLFTFYFGRLFVSLFQVAIHFVAKLLLVNRAILLVHLLFFVCHVKKRQKQFWYLIVATAAALIKIHYRAPTTSYLNQCWSLLVDYQPTFIYFNKVENN